MADTDYATLVELKARINKTGSGDDTPLQALLNAAALTIDNFCNRPDGFVADSSASARVYTGSGGAIQRIDECSTVSAVAVKSSATASSYTAWTTDDYIEFGGDPKRPDFQPTVKGKPYTALMIKPGGDYSHFTSGEYSSLQGFKPDFTVTRGVPTVQVTAKWGYASTVPLPIKEATITQAARWYKRGQSAWADTVGNPDLGQLMYRKKLDPDIELMLVSGRFVKPAL